MDGLLLFAHGARDPAWSAPFEAVARRIAEARPGLPLALAYLEFMAPDVAAGAQQLIDAGCTRIEVLPLFLGASGHVRRDIPPLIERLREQHGEQVRWTLHPAVGESALLVQAMAEIALNSLERTHPEAP